MSDWATCGRRSRSVALWEGRTRLDLEGDETAALATVRLLEILGEAAKNVSAETKEKYSRVPWREIAGTRDRLIHGYFDVDLDVVWSIISQDLPALLRELESILKSPDAGR
jgi:uncharacterized protein with HEPN domain